MKISTYNIEDIIRIPQTCCLIFFERYRTENSHHVTRHPRTSLTTKSVKNPRMTLANASKIYPLPGRNMIASIRLMPASIDCLGNIVMNENGKSEYEDNLEIVKRRDDKVGCLFFLFFYLPDYPSLMRKCWQ